MNKSSKANAFFERKEITEEDVERGGAHFTYRDGFRIGFGFFVGFGIALLIFTGIVYVFSSIIKLF